MERRMKIMLIAMAVLFGAIFLWKGISGWMFKRYMASQVNIATVSTIKVSRLPWQPTLKATGSLRAIKGVNITTELAGMVRRIHFTPGATVAENALLVELNADAEIGQLQSLQAQAALAALTYKRDQAQYEVRAVSKQLVDTDLQNWKSLLGQVAQQQATIAKKMIHAPFAGRLGINNINLGQYINPGDKIVTLQTLNPIYIDFYVPQQSLAQLAVGQAVTVKSDGFPKIKFLGKITTIEPAVDVTTRNVQVEATIDNPKYQLTPGMFALVEVDIDKPQRYLTVPQAAVSFNSYGNIVYVVQQKEKDNLIVKQVFVTTGDTRGDQITILKGLKEGDVVVTSGQLKLRNNSRVAINNTIVPDNSIIPNAPNEH